MAEDATHSRRTSKVQQRSLRWSSEGVEPVEVKAVGEPNSLVSVKRATNAVVPRAAVRMVEPARNLTPRPRGVVARRVAAHPKVAARTAALVRDVGTGIQLVLRRAIARLPIVDAERLVVVRRVDARRQRLPAGKAAGKVEAGVEPPLDVAKLGSLVITVERGMDGILNVEVSGVVVAPRAVK